GTVEQVRLERSPSAGPAARVALDRRALARALALGCATARVAPGRPVVFEGRGRTLGAMPLDPALAVGPAGATDPAGATGIPHTETPEGRTDVKHETDGRPPGSRPDPPAAGPSDPLAAAEDLRSALA